MFRLTRPALLALPVLALAAPLFAGATLTVTSDNRSGSALAKNGPEDVVQVTYGIGPREFLDPVAFNQCANALPAKGCLNTASSFLGLTAGNAVTGFTVDSVLTATKGTPTSQMAISDEDILVGFKVTGATSGDPYILRLEGGRSGTIGTFSVTFRTLANVVLFSGPATGLFDTTLELQNGDYLLEIAANITSSGSSTGGTFSYSLDASAFSYPPGCGVPGTGSCLQAKGTPFCSDTTCCDFVCDYDVFCCQNSWDDVCANAALNMCYPERIAGPMINPLTGRRHSLYSFGAWTITEQRAAAANEELTTIRDARENEWLRRNLLNGVPGVSPLEAWIGLNDQTSEGSFVWESGEAASFAAWTFGEPDNGAGGQVGEDFVAMLPASGRWVDRPTFWARRGLTESGRSECGAGGDCFAPHGPGCADESCCNNVCAWDVACCDLAWDAECISLAEVYCMPSVIAGPFINPKNRHRYWITESAAWTECQELAMTMGGYLVIPGNATENEWLRLNLASPTVAVFKCWLGVHDQLVENTFQTALGPVATYTNWNAGEPNNLGDEDFVMMWSTATGTWNDAPNMAALYGVIEAPCTGDLNDDGKVDGSDIAILLGAWSTGQVDLTNDGVADGADLAVMLGGWGVCATSDCCSQHSSGGCDQPGCLHCVCETDPFCCNAEWDEVCVVEASNECNAACQCGG